MGCFNVSCSISKLPIKENDEIYVLPLIKNKEGAQGSSKVLMLDIDEFFSPLCFPIKGEYNDYGSIKRIKHNKNTKAIEKFFKLSIENFISIICDTRGSNLYDRCCNVYDLLFKDKEILEYNVSLKDFFKYYNFTETNNGFEKNGVCFSCIDINGNINFNNTESNKIFINEKLCEYASSKEDILNIFAEETNIYLGLKDGYENLINILLDTHIMFINKKVYEELTKDFLCKELNYCKKEKGFMKEEINSYLKDIEQDKINYSSFDNDFINRKLELTYKLSFINKIFDNFPYFINIYKDNMISYEKEMEEYFYLLINMNATHNIFFPSLGGSQSEYYLAYENLNKVISLEINKEKDLT